MKINLLSLFLICFICLQSQVPVSNQMSIYPNPASSGINISFSETVRTDVVVTVSDILGNKIETFKFIAGTPIYIDLSSMSLKNGLYLIKAEAGDQSFVK